MEEKRFGAAASAVHAVVREDPIGEGVELEIIRKFEGYSVKASFSTTNQMMPVMEALEYARTNWPDSGNSAYSLRIFDAYEMGIIGTRTYNQLNGLGILTLNDLVKRTPAELKRLRGFGSLCMAETRNLLKEYDMHLRGDGDWYRQQQEEHHG